MAGKFKEFREDCLDAGTELARAITPPILGPVLDPFLGPLLGVSVAPVLLATVIAYDTLTEKKQIWTRSQVSDAEKSIREIFGDIALRGYTEWDGGIEMRLTESCVHNIFSDGTTDEEAPTHRINIHHNREQCAKDLLGSLAQGATPYGRSMSSDEERFIVVRKKGELTSRFYEVAHIDTLQDAPESAITATHHYYKSGIGHGGIDSTKHYAIMPVDQTTAERLRKLNL